MTILLRNRSKIRGDVDLCTEVPPPAPAARSCTRRRSGTRRGTLSRRRKPPASKPSEEALASGYGDALSFRTETKLLLEPHPEAAREKDRDGNLPLHTLCQNERAPLGDEPPPSLGAPPSPPRRRLHFARRLEPLRR